MVLGLIGGELKTSVHEIIKNSTLGISYEDKSLRSAPTCNKIPK